MGVPSFYRWLVEKYPKVIVNAIDEGEDSASQYPNPNGEFDNLYLDMNGIIHPCFHPDHELFAPSSFDEVFIAIFEYIDRLFRIVRPRKLLFLAVDGVAPRAKMNQQRARRYRTAKDAEIAEIEEQRLRKEFEREGKELLPKEENLEVADSNIITPGTVFMQKLSMALEYYIRLRLNNDPSWKSIMVILSDANVPGEGEHKIMSFMRVQRRLPGYNPNTRHCIYGLDADLIMLALATHEIHFCVLREDVLKQDNQEKCLSRFVANSSQKELELVKSREWFKKFEKGGFKKVGKEPYQFLNVWTLREYLELDMKPHFNADIERIVDDFIFICFFTGNDFLPHLPSIQIHESGIDLLIAIYKKMFKHMGDHLVDASNINKENAAYLNFKALRLFMIEVGSYEDKIFEKRYTIRQKKLQRLLEDRAKEENDGIDYWNPELNVTQESDNCRIGGSDHALDSFSTKCNISSSDGVEAGGSIQSDAFKNTKELKQKLKQFLLDKADLFKNDLIDRDKVRLGIPGWKARYYKEKFSAENTKEVEAVRKNLVKKYVEGLCWVLHYYFTGICSWSWFYPFYYGPFASDFKDLSSERVSFKLGKPFKPFDQLMAVLPPRSSHALPKAYSNLMNDNYSPIADFYPEDFAVDNDGKRFAWQGVSKLPFIEEEILLGITKTFFKELKDDEVERNSVGDNKIFVMDFILMDGKVSLNHQVPENYPNETQNHNVLGASCGINDLLSFCEESSPSKFFSPVLGMEDIAIDRSRCAKFVIQKTKAHIPRLLEGTITPEKTVTDSDIVKRQLWHEYHGHFPPQRTMNIEAPKERSMPANEDEGWVTVGRGKQRSNALTAGTGYERGPSSMFSESHLERKFHENPMNASGQCSAFNPYVSNTTRHDRVWQTAGRPMAGRYEGYENSMNACGRGQYDSYTTPSVSTMMPHNETWRNAGRPVVGKNAMNARGLGQYVGPNTHFISTTTSYNKFGHMEERQMTGRSKTNTHGQQYGTYNLSVSTLTPYDNIRRMETRPMVDRFDDGRERSMQMVSTWGQGRAMPAASPRGYGSQIGGHGGRGGCQNLVWVQSGEQTSASIAGSSGLGAQYPMNGTSVNGGRGRGRGRGW